MAGVCKKGLPYAPMALSVCWSVKTKRMLGFRLSLDAMAPRTGATILSPSAHPTATMEPAFKNDRLVIVLLLMLVFVYAYAAERVNRFIIKNGRQNLAAVVVMLQTGTA